MIERVQDARSRIIKATMEILDEEPDHNKITVRRIAEKANVGIGLINYHFQSKEKLLNESVGTTMGELADSLRDFSKQGGVDPIARLKNMLNELCSFGLRYEKLLQIGVGYELTQGSMEVPLYIVPVLREIYGREKDERELRLIAFMLITTLQVIFLRSETFHRYSGIDVRDEEQRNQAVEMLIDNVVKR